jgi:hypothetical protein
VTGIAAAFALSLAIAVGSASAKTVYDYEYSGTFFDGSTAGKTFTGNIGGIVLDRSKNQFLIANGGEGGEPGWITKLNATTFAPVNFSGLGIPRLITSGANAGLSSSAQVDVDQTGGPNAGNIYVASGNAKQGYFADGTPIPNFADFEESRCGAAADPGGELVLTGGRNGLRWFTTPGNEFDHEVRVGYPGYEPGKKNQWSERGKACKAVFDGNGDIVGIKGGVSLGSSDSKNYIVKLNPEGFEVFQLTRTQEYTNAAIDYSNDDIFVTKAVSGGGSFEYYDTEGRKLGEGFGEPDGPYLGMQGGFQSYFGITVDPVTHDVWIANERDYGGGVRHVEKFVRTNPHIIPDVTAEEPIYDDPAGESVSLKGTLNPDGVETTDCYFEWGLTQQLGEVAPCAQGDNFGGSTDQVVTAKVSTPKGVRYYYKLFAKNGNEQLASSNTQSFFPQYVPTIKFAGVDRISTDNLRFLSEFDPNGGNATVHFEWGHEGNFEFSSEESDTFGFATNEGNFSGTDVYDPGVKFVAQLATGLEPNTTYEFRAAVTNEAGTTYSPVKQFTTYPPDPSSDPCPNAQVRQQVEASLVPDCRAYELVSAADAGGYDVVSDLVPGQTPLQAYPRADDSLLYSIHFGLIPGISGSPTNFGLDPYLAKRGPDGWSTSYVGLPADGMADAGAFGSPLLGADSGLHSFAFGGEGICDPCFSDDESTNVPLRLADGSLVKGMGGSSNPAADPVGEVRKPLSEDGSHFVFGSDKVFESSANSGAAWIYDRDLDTGTTQLASTMPNGTPISGEVAELDLSNDGERILIGKVVGEDSAGNRLYDLYMHVGGSPNSIVVADTTNGVIFTGMTGDGTQVFFTTTDALSGDSDSGADLYRADVGGTSPAPVSRISTGTGGAGNTDACTPIDDWNVSSGGPDCSVVAFTAGSGIARDDGTAYFVSPELLDAGAQADGEADEANLYVVKPGGTTHFVGLLDSSKVKAGPQPPNHPVEDNALVAGLSKQPQAMTVDQSNGDIYVIERTGGTGTGSLDRFDSTGAPKNFTAGPNAGTNKLTGLNVGLAGRAGVAVDASGSPLEGSIYVKSANGTIRVYAPTGEEIGSLTGFGDACGVAVDQSSGVVYVGDRTAQRVYRFEPTSGSTPVSRAGNYSEEAIQPNFGLCAVAADGQGNVYVGDESTNFFLPPGPIKRYKDFEFDTGTPPVVEGTEISALGSAMMVDPATDYLYVNKGNQIAVFDPSGKLLQEFGSGFLGSESRGIAVNGNNGKAYAPSGEVLVEFGVEPVPYIPIDQPGIRHGVFQAGVHSFEDFQVSPDGRYAAFSSAVPMTGTENQGFVNVFRYDADVDSLDCASCAPTGALPGSDTKLSATGLNLSDDGHVFFTTLESLALRDTNGRKDAYQWQPDGTIGLLTTGISPDDSGLVTVSADGVNAFFYTRDVLTPEDENSNTVKVYVARRRGGFPFDPSRLPCAASDECHGAGTAAPPAPDIKSVTGTGPREAAEPEDGSRCRNIARRAKKNSDLAKRLRQRATRSSNAKQARALRRRAQGTAKKARSLNKKAQACRRSSGGNG